MKTYLFLVTAALLTIFANAATITPNSSAGEKGDKSVVDFRRLSDRPASQITASQGEYVGFAGSDADYRVEGGRLKNYTGNLSTFYCEVRLPGPVRHAWMILEFGDAASIPEGGGCLLGIARNPGWIGHSAGMVVHDYVNAIWNGLPDNRWGAGTYPSAGLNTNFNLPWGGPLTKGYTFPGRTVKFEVTFDPKNGRTIHYVDGFPVHTAVEATRINAQANQVLIENVAPGVGVVEFGGSTNVPEGLFKEEFSSILSPFPITSNFNGTWQKLYVIKVLYPPSGMVEITANPYVAFPAGGGANMNLGPASGTEPDTYLADPFILVSAGIGSTWAGTLNFREIRGGAPGTVENVAVFIRATSGSYHQLKNPGPQVRAVGHMRVDN